MTEAKRSPETNFDLFLSYHSKDFSFARDLFDTLESLGLRVWFDKVRLRPGAGWVEALYTAVKQSASAMILIGPSGLGPWQDVEVKQALEGWIRTGKPLVVVILPGVPPGIPELPPFLEQIQLVDCRDGRLSHESLDNVIWGLTGRHLSRRIAQFIDDVEMTIAIDRRPARSQRVYQINAAPNVQLVDVSWDTFGTGIVRLCDQIRHYGRHLNVDATVGINDAGLAMATFINGQVLERAPLGNIRLGRANTSQALGDFSLLPDLPEEPRILLVDFEIKSGKGLQAAVARLRGRYRAPAVYLAVFGALIGSDRGFANALEHLASYESITASAIEDLFFACIMHAPGIEPPLGLR